MASNDSSATVTVACKLPHGVELRIFDMIDAVEPTRDGGKPIKVAQPRPQTFIVRGASYPEGGAMPPIAGGFALTSGIPKEFWDKWLEDNAKSDMVRNGMIFAHSSSRNVEAEAREKEKQSSGAERLDPNGKVGSRVTKGNTSSAVA